MDAEGGGKPTPLRRLAMRRKTVKNLRELPRDPDREIDSGLRRLVNGFRRTVAI
ncbi:MAG: hypothetical protein ABEJ69_01475 [Candidatus Nanohaloarchaea archaeon]